MKYQNFAIIFVIIVLPISIVLSYYIQSQTDTLTLQTRYQSKLNDSTYDAIASYQMNSLNTQRVTGESVKSYVLASVNTFFTTLATNLGMSSASKSRLQTYIPAILFTTYDGYYIYSPTKMAKVAENPSNGIGLTKKDESIVYVSKDAPIDYQITEQDVTNINNNNLGTNFTDESNSAKLENNYMLKPFIYYSARYKSNNYDFTASYTLDNYITVYGTRTATNELDRADYSTDYFSKSGYLIDPTKITLNGNILVKCVTRNERNNNSSSVEPSENGTYTYQAVITANKPENQELSSHNTVRYKKIDINSDDTYRYVNYFNYGDSSDGKQEIVYQSNGLSYYPARSSGNLDDNPTIRYQTGDEIIESTLDIEELLNTQSNDVNSYLMMSGDGNFSPLTVTYNGVTIEDREAKEYYIKAYFFSRWIQNNLSNVQAGSIVQDEDTKNNFEYTNFQDDTTRIFNISGIRENNPESDDSYFATHKRDVIKNSIQLNLNTAISTYNDTFYGNEQDSYNYLLPVLTADDWDSILNNITMVSFMQGIPCGLTTFNNYAVVKSNNNNTSVDLENLYFTEQIGRDVQSNSEYHKYDCPELGNFNGTYDGSTYESDLSAEFKYDAKKINTKVETNNNSETIICAYDDQTNTYYNIGYLDINGNKNDIDNIKVLYDNPIPTEQVKQYNFNGRTIDLTGLSNGSESLYLYDHQNTGCYTCIISGNYTPAVKMYNGELYRTFQTDTSKLVLEIESGRYINENGTEYNPTEDGNVITDSYQISLAELSKRRKSIYTSIAKYRNSLYKTNDYVNR